MERRRNRKPIGWGRKRGKPWTESDVECALFLRHCGLTNKDIGRVLKRSTPSIDGKIGYVGHQPYGNTTATFYERARPIIGKTWGDIADNPPCAGTA